MTNCFWISILFGTIMIVVWVVAVTVLGIIVDWISDKIGIGIVATVLVLLVWASVCVVKYASCIGVR